MARRTVVAIALWCIGSALVSGCDSARTVPAAATKTVTVARTPVDSEPTSSTATTSPKAVVFDNKAIQVSIAKILTDDYRLDAVGEVTCPAEQEVKDGTMFDCTVTVAAKQRIVTVTVKGPDGNYEVSTPK